MSQLKLDFSGRLSLDGKLTERLVIPITTEFMSDLKKMAPKKNFPDVANLVRPWIIERYAQEYGMLALLESNINRPLGDLLR